MTDLRLKVIKTEAPTAQIRALTLAAAEGGALPGYTAGSHIRVTLPDGDDRPYSLVNADPEADVGNAPQTYRLGVRLEEESKGGSKFMHGLSEGDVLSATMPKNDFKLIDSPAPAILFAGGIGVTPIISMAAELKRRGQPFEFHYSGRSRPLMAFVEDIEQACGKALSVYCDDETERAIDLKRLIGGASIESHIYVCGPRGMIEAVREIAHGRGFSKDHVHFELFDKPAQTGGDGTFEVEVKSSGAVFTIPPGKSIIEVLEAEGVDLVYDCQRGDCGICQTDVLEGFPDHRDVILTDEERASNKVMQICVSRAKSARLVLDL